MFLFRRGREDKFNGKRHSVRNGVERDGYYKSSIHGGFLEEQESKKALDQAGVCIEEGEYATALLLLENARKLFPSNKSLEELFAVTEVWYAATQNSCRCLLRKARSLDWYRILKVDEHSKIADIKRRYHQLVLLLHPDKNKDVNAEAAFKLVSEAYTCLSDKTRRAIYDMERSKLECKQCVLKQTCMKGESRERESVPWRSSCEYNFDQTGWGTKQETSTMSQESARVRICASVKAWKDRRSKWTKEFDIRKEKDQDKWSYKVAGSWCGFSSRCSSASPYEPDKRSRFNLSSSVEHSKRKSNDDFSQETSTAVKHSGKCHEDVNRSVFFVSTTTDSKRGSEMREVNSVQNQHFLGCTKKAVNGSGRTSHNHVAKSKHNQVYCPGYSEFCLGSGILEEHRQLLLSKKVKDSRNNHSSAIRSNLLSGEKDQAAQNKSCPPDQIVIFSCKDTEYVHNKLSVKQSSQIDNISFKSKFLNDTYRLQENIDGASKGINEQNSDAREQSEGLPAPSFNFFVSSFGRILNTFSQAGSSPLESCPNSRITSNGGKGSLCNDDRYVGIGLHGDQVWKSKTSTKSYLAPKAIPARDLLQQRTAGLNDGRCPGEGDTYQPCSTTNKLRPISKRLMHKVDSLDLEEIILQTQKQKYEELLKTLEHIREEAKLVMTTLRKLQQTVAPGFDYTFNSFMFHKYQMACVLGSSNICKGYTEHPGT